MSATKQARGLVPSRIRGAGYNTAGTNEYSIASGAAASMYTGTPVRISAGYVVALTSAGETTDGVFQGCRYVEDGEQKFKAYWAGGTSATDAVAFVQDNPNATYIMQCNSTIAQSAIGQNVAVSGVGGGSTFTGQSSMVAKASTVGAGVLDLKIVGVVNEPGNAVGDAYTKIEVTQALHADNFRQVYVTAPVTSTAGN